MPGNLIWRSSPPSSPGFYFVRAPGLRTRVVQFERNGGRIEGGPSYIFAKGVRHDFAGPIAEPQEADFLPVPAQLIEENE